MLPCGRRSINEDDPHNIHITEIEGEREVEGPSLESELFFAQIKVKKVNIGTTDNPKMESIGTIGMNKQ
jgi:hypothetical protein